MKFPLNHGTMTNFTSNLDYLEDIQNGTSTRDVFDNTTRSNGTEDVGHQEDSVHDKKYDISIRIICLYIMIILGITGAILVFIWMWFNRRLKSRVNLLILNLTLADLGLVLFGSVPQLIWEYFDREWIAGEFMCRLVKYLQGLGLMSSSYLLVILAIDRHQAIRAPLREPLPVWALAGIGWGISMAAAFPQWFVFRLNVVEGEFRCENIFRKTRVNSHRAAYITYALVMSFLVPLIVLTICYARIFLKISQKAAESNTNRRQTFKPGKVHLQSTPSSSLPKAKIKTLKMTVVIVTTFIVFGMPYFISEMIMSYGDYRILNEVVYAILGAVAPASSSINPYVFLLFNANWRCLVGLRNALPWSNAVHDRRRYVYSNTSMRTEFTSMNSDIVRSSMYKPAIADRDAVEMSTLH